MAAPPMNGQEARTRVDDHAALKLWLRLLSCVNDVEAEVRRRLREHFDMSLSRFDFLAQLHRWPEGLKMSELSRHLMVTGGNVTTLTDELAREGFVTREHSPSDRRSWIVRMTPQGRTRFEVIASEHERWILELFESLDPPAIRQVYKHLGVLRHQLTGAAASPTP